jgi:hypothetical protein
LLVGASQRSRLSPTCNGWVSEKPPLASRAPLAVSVASPAVEITVAVVLAV